MTDIEEEGKEKGGGSDAGSGGFHCRVRMAQNALQISALA